MRISLALESLLPRELAPRFALSREPYGHALALVAFRRRLLVDVSRAQR